ncbi:hypothetical protein LV85_01085 [Algoriphagus chordae]|uniref:Uncharacterized protein n=1 Tax=Algoriphagus chordae TaxID=237019 RepID=A0A2W7RC28_9BACT|nr:hypothetical protein LV85_01085 [Algoriphagus chordae]
MIHLRFAAFFYSQLTDTNNIVLHEIYFLFLKSQFRLYDHLNKTIELF